MMLESARHFCLRVVSWRKRGQDISDFFKHGKAIDETLQCVDVDMRELDMGIVVEQEYTAKIEESGQTIR